MKCIYCGYHDSKVIDSRLCEDGAAIRRRRECLKCGKRFTTYEKIEGFSLVVIKKDKSRQPFDRAKLLSGLLRACEKRPVSIKQLEALVDDVETQIYNAQQREIKSKDIGENVLKKLRDIDAVAYVRFASVYRDFQDVETFMTELKAIMK